MADVIIRPGKMYGSLNLSAVAPSKSFLHRHIICEALSGGQLSYFDSDDICATHEVMSHILTDKDVCYVGESASTLRFLIPLSVLLGGRTFKTSGRLSERPLHEYECMKDASVRVVGKDVITSGRLTSGDFTLQGDISSQFVSGLMFALVLCDGDSRILIKKPLRSRNYAEMTRRVLSEYGVKVLNDGNGYIVLGNQKYLQRQPSSVEGDWSYGAFFTVANALGCDISLTGLCNDSIQADACISYCMAQDDIDISQSPDIFPILCVWACAKKGKTVIRNGETLRFKECDRIHAMATELRKLGAHITEKSDGVIIEGTGKLRGGTLHSHGDHRIAMALSVAAACVCDGEVMIRDAECVRKSAPQFFSHMKQLHADIIMQED
ncbi:MAG: 3-phosphoshikimate 1-carboxyvinyltransferase [Clostridia bacterium]|nr:3-phosphoshikimate 1-carboxyvinyltransferase [Clostridia bacterium]